MRTFNALLDRYCEERQLTSQDQLLAAYQERTELTISELWRAWCEAEKAIRNQQIYLAHNWVNISLTRIGHQDEGLCKLEFTTLKAKILAMMDEPRSALPFARDSAAAWKNIILDIGLELILVSAKELLVVLSEPHSAPAMENSVILMEWMEDRLSPNLHSSALQLIEICGSLRRGQEAEEVAIEHMNWHEKAIEALPNTKEVAAFFNSNIEMKLGDIFDKCGNREKAIEHFKLTPFIF